jgi:hypothetical protein
MITGAHFLFYSADADADRAFFKDMLGFRAVDAGDGWLIFALPPAEAAVHPSAGSFVQAHADRLMAGAVLYLLCDRLDETMADLARRGASLAPVGDAPWGRFTALTLPSGGAIGLYEPKHETAIGR